MNDELIGKRVLVFFEVSQGAAGTVKDIEGDWLFIMWESKDKNGVVQYIDSYVNIRRIMNINILPEDKPKIELVN